MTGHLAEVLELCRYPVRGGFSLVSDSNIYGEVISCSKSQEHGAPAPLGGGCRPSLLLWNSEVPGNRAS